ncbi:hypothetical protein M422DRAFT_271781 [Sphaerobolus stellatus SS14]|uniref:F-box domain-containing protein n=1 Tax=Sphaerobolus stellatus (strain SS14) TaxID=990650 RepID=A0A0C9UNN2_SPHS4|nr:hypothetical protein M422DRAFT_271781 [Sphaerobolus stellatus SS14]
MAHLTKPYRLPFGIRMSPLQNLPIELLLRIIEGQPLETTWNLTRTCSLFRRIGLQHRRLWLAAPDFCKLLPIPPPDTLHIVSADTLVRLATRAVFISRAFDAEGIIPRSVFERPLSFFPDVRDPDDNTVTAPVSDALFVLLPGVPWVLIRSEELCLSCLEDDRRVRISEIGEPLIDWDLSLAIVPDYDTDGLSFTIASLITAPDEIEEPLVVYIYQVSFDAANPSASPAITVLFATGITEDEDAYIISMCQSTIVVSGGLKLHIFDWKKGFSFTVPDTQDAIGTCHHRISTLIVIQRYERNGSDITGVFSVLEFSTKAFIDQERPPSHVAQISQENNISTRERELGTFALGLDRRKT